MFKPGEMVCHPRHGVGLVIEIKHMKIAGGDGLYYAVDLATGEKLLIPVSQRREAGLRAVTRPEKINDVLASAPQALADDFRQRAADLEEKVISGDSLLVAEALRDLAWRQHSSKLSNGDARQLDKARKTLANMLVAKPQMDLREATRRLDAMLEQVVIAWGAAG